MLVTGDYLAPQFNFEPRAQKPPLTYWAILLSYKLFGISEFAVRLPSALAAIGTLLFSYAMARFLFSPRAALFAVVITATTARLFILARRLPSIPCFFFYDRDDVFSCPRHSKECASQLGFCLWFCRARFLTKGPVALIIPAGAYVLWRLWRRDIRFTGAHPLMGATIFVCIALPGTCICTDTWLDLHLPLFPEGQPGKICSRVLRSLPGPLYYFSVYATDFFPWSFSTLVAAFSLCSTGNKHSPYGAFPSDCRSSGAL